MFSCKLKALGLPLLGACLAFVVLATTSASAANRGDPFQLGVGNSIDFTTSLSGTTAAPQLKVVNLNGDYAGIRADSAGGAGAALLGYHSSAEGTGPGVFGQSNSTAASAFSVYGLLTASAPAGNNAAVRGQNNSTSGYGYGVWGSQAGSGTGVFGSSVTGVGVRGLGAPGVYGSSTAANGSGVRGTANNGLYASGVSGTSASGAGVYGFSSGGIGQGVSGNSTATNGVGVIGNANNGANALGVFGKSTSGIGVRGFSSAVNGSGVRGTADNGLYASGVSGTSASGAGVYGFSSGGTGQGVSGNSTATNGVGVIGQANNGAAAVGVLGKSTSATGVSGQSTAFDGYGGKFSGGYTGVYGSSPAAAGFGVYGEADTGVFGTSTSGDGVYGFTSAGASQQPLPAAVRAVAIGQYSYGISASSKYTWAGYFQGGAFMDGDLWVTGSCTGCAIGAGSMKIDDPLDPARKYLQHAAVASSEQLDLYSGNVVTDERGFATVSLPRWFQALNRSFRYQLTVVDKAHWEARAAVWEEIADNRFTIRTDQPQVKVSWLVTGIRNDPYANQQRSAVEVPKPAGEEGKYLHPELYGKPKSDAIGDMKTPAAPQR